jgi:hypothetical protein
VEKALAWVLANRENCIAKNTLVNIPVAQETGDI